MKRDWDIIRELLIEVEALGHQNGMTYRPGRQDQTKVDHALLLHEAGFISGSTAAVGGARMLLDPQLTWQGHELLDTLRSKPIWERVKKMAQEKGVELTFDTVKQLAAKALAAVIAS